MAYTDAISELLRQSEQKKIGGAAGLTPLEMEGALAGIYGAEAQTAQQREQAAIQNQQRQEYINMAKSGMRSQQISSMIGGMGQLGAGLQKMGLLGGFGASAGGFGAQTVADVASGVAAPLGLEGSQALADAATAAWYGGESALGSSSAGLLGDLGSGLTGGLAGGIGGFAGGMIGRAIGGKTGGEIGGALGGAGMGFAFGGPIGGIIGGIAGFLGGGGSVICTELCRQGYFDELDKNVYHDYCDKYIDVETYVGYRSWADGVVTKMRNSATITKLVALIAMPYVREGCHKIMPDVFASSYIGKIVATVGIPICRLIGKWKMRKVGISIVKEGVR